MIFTPEGYRDPQPVDVNAIGTRWLTYLIFASAVVVYYLLPIWAGVFTETFGFNHRQVGWLLSADMLTNTLAAFSARYWIHRVYWRRVLPLTVLVTILPNFLCALTETFEVFLLLRYIAGLGAGALVAFMYATVAASKNPDREFAYAMSLQVALGALFLNGSAWLWINWGAGSIFVLCGLAALLPLLCFSSIPRVNPLGEHVPEANVTNDKSTRISLVVFIGLLAVCLFFASMNSIWSFMERVGDAEGFSREFIAKVLSFSLFFSFAGALVPAWLAGRVKRIITISSGYLFLLFAIYAMGQHPPAISYALALCVYNFFYSFVIPFQSGWIASLDDSGRTAVLLPAFQGVGIAAGPLLAGLVIVGEEYANVIYVSMTLLVCSFFLYYLMYRRAGSDSATHLLSSGSE